MPGAVVEGVVKQEGGEKTQAPASTHVGGGGGPLVSAQGRVPGALSSNGEPSESVKALRAQQRQQQKEQQPKRQSKQQQKKQREAEERKKIEDEIRGKSKEDIKRELANMQRQLEEITEQFPKAEASEKKTLVEKRKGLSLPMDISRDRLREMAEEKAEGQLNIKNWLTEHPKTEAAGPQVPDMTRVPKSGRIETSEELLEKIQGNPYLLHATDFTTPYIYNVTHLTDRFRLYNGGINEI